MVRADLTEKKHEANELKTADFNAAAATNL